MDLELVCLFPSKRGFIGNREYVSRKRATVGDLGKGGIQLFYCTIISSINISGLVGNESRSISIVAAVPPISFFSLEFF